MNARLDSSGLPKRLGAYTLRHLLGRGGMGEVFVAERDAPRDEETACVIKTVRAELTTEPELISRFMDEARIAMRMRHPHIARVFDFGQIDDVMYLAMELVDGGGVEQLIGAQRPVPEAAALQITCDILAGLDYAHHAMDPETRAPLGVVHRDVSPANALVHKSGLVKLIDFGLALSAVKQTKTADGSVVLGKLAYASPESARGHGVDHRTDQFSAAVLCYELLTGERFYGDLEGVALWRVVSEGAHRPAGLKGLKPVLRAVLECALSAAPEQRFDTCGALRAELARVIELHHDDTGRAQLLSLYGLDGELDPVTDELDEAEARAIASASGGAALIPPSPRSSTVVSQMLAADVGVTEEEDPTRIVSLEPEEATMAGAPLPSLSDAEATVAGAPLPIGAGDSEGEPGFSATDAPRELLGSTSGDAPTAALSLPQARLSLTPSGSSRLAPRSHAAQGRSGASRLAPGERVYRAKNVAPLSAREEGGAQERSVVKLAILLALGAGIVLGLGIALGLLLR